MIEIRNVPSTPTDETIIRVVHADGTAFTDIAPKASHSFDVPAQGETLTVTVRP